MFARFRKQSAATVAPPEAAAPSVENVPDPHLYATYQTGVPVLQPWFGDADIRTVVDDLVAKGLKTLVSDDRLQTLKWAFAQTARLDGEVWELGVYQGGSALLLRRLADRIAPATILRFFDSFEGLPSPTPDDLHLGGDFADTSLEAVRALVGVTPNIKYHQGWIPDTLTGLEDRWIRFAHVDLDLYRSILDACAFIYPRLRAGGVIVVDDYGLPSCPGARKAVDEFFSGKHDVPLIVPSGQAIVVKGQDAR